MGSENEYCNGCNSGDCPDKDWCEKVMDLYPFAEKRVHDKNYKFSKYFYFILHFNQVYDILWITTTHL